MRCGATVVLALAACGGAPDGHDAPARCATPTALSTRTLGATTPVPVLAIARGTSDLAIAYVDRPMLPRLAHLTLQHVALDGTIAGEPIVIGPVDQEIPGPVTIALDGSEYVACTIAVGGASCFRVDAGGPVGDPTMVLDTLALAISNGPGGVMGAWLESDGLEVGPLDAPTGVLARTDAPPSIAATGDGYVVGYEAEGSAYVVTLDASGHASAPTTLGPASATTRVAVAYSGGHVGAGFVDPSGDAILAVMDAGRVTASTIGPGAASRGQIAIAPARDGFFATWSGASGSIEGSFVDFSAAPTGARFTHAVGTSDAAHALVALTDAFVLVASGASVDVTLIGCP